jgi:diguanylate cyclase (GGDEF)-like protein
MFVLDAELAQWEDALALSHGPARRHLCLTLAWHLRQRDSARARSLAQQVLAMLDDVPTSHRAQCEARVDLIEGEIKWLNGELDLARRYTDRALHRFDALNDERGCADTHWLRGWIEADSGNGSAGDAEFAAGARRALRSEDPMRIAVLDANSALFAVFRNLQRAEARWGQRFNPDTSTLHPAAAAWVCDFFGTRAFQASDFAGAVRHLMRAYEALLATGQWRRAVNAATNIGNGFTSLNAHHVALEWMERGLALARKTGWPMSIGLGMLQTAETLRQLGQRDAAFSMLSEARQVLAPLSGSRAYAVALEYQGDLALDCGDYLGALESFQALSARGEALGQFDFQSGARRGQAHALSMLKRPQEALDAVGAALAFAREQGDAVNEILALRVLAEIHADHDLPPPEPLMAPNAALHYLQQALTLAATIDDFIVPGDLLDTLARQYAAVGDYARAYEVSLQASATREKTHSHEATNRAVAMQVQYQTERAEAEGAHHRQLAQAEAQRAEVLQQASDMLEHLSAIGQEITTHLDTTAVFRALDRHVHGLLDATHFSVLLIESDGESLRCAFGVEDGKPLPSLRIGLDDAEANSARCVRERAEILIEHAKGTVPPFHIPGTLNTLSLLFAPLLIGERVLGVMTVQSMQEKAYGERERLIFRTLCAYGAIALDNASAYRQVAATLKVLSATQAQLLDKNLELERAYKALEEVSLTDQLTGLRNRRFFMQHVDADVAMCLRRYDEPVRLGEVPEPGRDLVFFMVDLDHFKEVNDHYGHAAGDAVLVQMQERLREVFRESDYLIRWGGEEFLVLARATHRDEAKVVAERIRSAVADRDFELPDGVRLRKTCSIGFACYPFMPSQPRLLPWTQVVELADQGLYLAKHGGRNAWAGIYDGPISRPDDLFPRLMQQLDQQVLEGQARIVTSMHELPREAGEKPRRLLAGAD